MIVQVCNYTKNILLCTLLIYFETFYFIGHAMRLALRNYLAEKYELSPRTVYRYVEILAKTVPVQITCHQRRSNCDFFIYADNHGA